MKFLKINFEIAIIIIALVIAIIPRASVFNKYGVGISNDSY
jgi:hypothetical protein